MIGETLGHYTVLEKLGSGGMGEVYLAEDTRLRRRVALKVLPASMAADPERLERFTREAMAVGALDHPNIVTIYSIEHAGGLQVLAMELVEGGTLAETIPPGGLSEEDFFRLAIPLAEAISAAHERGVTHRDLKPSNVMITGDGRVKVVDFGLAKLRQEAAARESTVMLDDDLTEAGRILGTYPYMSPEQIKGKPADHRADIFSLGVVLYEMATGARPFRGETSADLISSILRDQPPPTHEVNRDLPRHLDRILSHCLEKDPDRRFQTAKDLRNELQSLRTEIESERLVRTTTSGLRRLSGTGRFRWLRSWEGRRLGWVAGLAALAVAGAVTLALFLGGDAAPGRAGAAGAGSGVAAAAAEDQRPSVAVLFFQNLTGEAELEWLRAGLAEMLVTDLSQSPEIRVVPTDRLYQILRDLGAVDQAILSSDLVREVAEAAGARSVLLGSYARAGENLLVNVTLQDTESGEIVDAQRVQGDGVGSVFSIVDRLSRSVRGSFERSGRMAETRRQEPQRGIEAVTTSSVEAYRFYAEGMRLNNELKVNEAIALFERATELDPGFAMAHARLARIYETLGREEELEAALDRAIANAERLPARERYYVGGMHQSLERKGYGEAIETLEEAVDVYPDHHAARYQLGLLYSYLELHEQAAAEFEELLARGHATDGAYNSLASVYGSLGRSDDARRLLTEWVDADPERWSALLVLSWHAVNWGDPQLAIETLERAESIRSGSSWVVFFRFRAFMDGLRLDQAEAAARPLLEDREPYWQWRGNIANALLDLYRGRGDEALARFAAAGDAYEGREPLIGTAKNLEAGLLLSTGRPERALRAAEEARRVAAGDWPAWEGMLHAALAHQELGRPAEADRLAAELAAIAARLPGEVEERLHHRLLGLLARERGDLATARRELEAAVELLPARGLLWHRHRIPDHAPLWYELAEVCLEQGDTRAAERWLRTLAESTTERIEHPVETVRGQYLLGRVHEETGARTPARDAYRAFLAYWEGGRLDRERVEDARRRLSALE